MASGISNNNRQGLYIAGGTLLGAGVGVGTAILNKPYLDADGGMTTDFFVKSRKNILSDYLKNNSDMPEIEKFQDLLKELKTVNSKESLDEFILKNNTKDVNLIKKTYKESGFDAAKLLTELFIEGDRNSMAEKLLWEGEDIKPNKLALNFEENYKKLSKETQASVKKAMSEITRKKALLYGGFGAVIALFLASLTALFKNKKAENQ